MLHTYDDFHVAFKENGLKGYHYPENYVPEKFKEVMRFWWGGGMLRHDIILDCMLNGWFLEMETVMKKGKEKKSIARFLNSNECCNYRDKWRTHKNIIDDGTSDELFFGIIELAKKHKEKIESDQKKKAEYLKQRKNYKTIRLLKKDIPEILSLIENHCSDNELIERFHLACKK